MNSNCRSTAHNCTDMVIFDVPKKVPSFQCGRELSCSFAICHHHTSSSFSHPKTKIFEQHLFISLGVIHIPWKTPKRKAATSAFCRHFPAVETLLWQGVCERSSENLRTNFINLHSGTYFIRQDGAARLIKYSCAPAWNANAAAARRVSHWWQSCRTLWQSSFAPLDLGDSKTVETTEVLHGAISYVELISLSSCK